ncbi:MAG: flavodoxin family protein [Pseudomonadota bacterium]|jgi:multimeric flavodoxin WrbA
MSVVSIVYHSGRGHTEVIADAIGRGSRAVSGTEVHLISVDDVSDDTWALLNRSDAIIFGAPTYMGSASAPMKAFMDKTSRFFARTSWRDKLAAGFTNSASQSGDKLNTLTQLAIFAAQHSMLWVSLGLPPGNNSSAGSPEDLNRLGSFLGAMAQSNADEPAAVAPPPTDQRTAEMLGKRVAELACMWAPALRAFNDQGMSANA